MNKRIESQTTFAAMPAAPSRLSMFGARSLLPGEDGAAYGEMLRQILNAVKPADTLEEIWAHDAAYWVWEEWRLRRLRASRITQLAHDILEETLYGDGTNTTVKRLLKGFLNGDQGAVDKISRMLAARGLTMDGVMAQALSDNLDEFERIDRLMTTAGSRRIMTLREVDRHRTGLGASLRRAADVVDAEFEDLETKHIEEIHDVRT